MNRSHHSLPPSAQRPRVTVRIEPLPKVILEDDTPYRLPRAMPTWLAISVLAVGAGACVGAIVGPVGIAVGASFGLVIGSFAGIFLSRETRRSASRTRELDAIIGTTSGNLGTSKATLDAHAVKVQRAVRESWGPDCMTPPPPMAGTY